MLEHTKDVFIDTSIPEISDSVTQMVDRQEFLAAMCQVLQETIPCDVLAWNGLDLETGVAEIVATPLDLFVEAAISPQRMADLDDHPMVISYTSGAAVSDRPRRLADLISSRDLRRTRTYSDLLRPLRSEQMMTILTGRSGHRAAKCWTFARHTRPFSDDELARAHRLQGALTALEAYSVSQSRVNPASWTSPKSHVASAAMLGTGADDPASEGLQRAWPIERGGSSREATERSGLTPRELEVLALVAEGFTAGACGHILRISEATVRKHLGNTYAKLDCSDRLIAVTRARTMGLIS